MEADLRSTTLFEEARELYSAARRPGTGRITDAVDVSASPNGTVAAFAGMLTEDLEGAPKARICLTELHSGDTQVLTFGPNSDRTPKFSPDGRLVAFLSDRRKAGDSQLYLLDPCSGAASATPQVDGWVEYLAWSPDSSRILLGVAGHGADRSSGQGATTSKQADAGSPSWMPIVETGEEAFRFRRVFIYDLEAETLSAACPHGFNIWEANWCGNDKIAAIASPGATEGCWYSASLQLIDLQTGSTCEIYRPRDQLAWPSCSPSGRWIAVVEAVCSDRGAVAGDLRIIDAQTLQVSEIDTRQIDVSHTEWRSEDTLLFAGHRDFETTVALFHAHTRVCEEVWTSEEITTGGLYARVSGFGDRGDCVLIGENFQTAPEIAVIRAGAYKSVKSFDAGFADQLDALESVENVRWTAPDGMEIHGYLLRPASAGSFPTILHVHGGPIWAWRPAWLGRSGIPFLMLLKRGYAIFYPNPRGSAGRGQNFARHVVGDMNGAETQDLLSGLDALVQRGVADSRRLGVTGGSYGGNMTSWLVTQDDRFAAAVSVAPHTNQFTTRLTSNIPDFVDLVLQDDFTDPAGKYFSRSPVMHVGNVKTPILNIAGVLDRCTPPAEAVQFHNALRLKGARSALALYPEEGHGIRSFPAILDYSARLVGWFEEHIN